MSIDKKLIGVGLISIGYFELIVWGLQSGLEPILGLWAAGLTSYIVGLWVISFSDKPKQIEVGKELS